MKRQLQSSAMRPDPENHAWKKGRELLSSPSSLLRRRARLPLGGIWSYGHELPQGNRG